MGAAYSAIFFGFVLGAAMAYFIPTLIAWIRMHPRTMQVFLINFFFGWSFIGWVVALVIACGPTAARVDVTVLATPANNDPANADDAHESRVCPLCAGEIPTTALKCRHCGEWVVPESKRPATT